MDYRKIRRKNGELTNLAPAGLMTWKIACQYLLQGALTSQMDICLVRAINRRLLWSRVLQGKGVLFVSWCNLTRLIAYRFKLQECAFATNLSLKKF